METNVVLPYLAEGMSGALVENMISAQDEAA
jgi:hypothetical protein